MVFAELTQGWGPREMKGKEPKPKGQRPTTEPMPQTVRPGQPGGTRR